MLDINEAMVDPHNRLNNYIRSKIAAEAYITKYFRDITVILRPRGLIGPGDTSIAPRLIRANAVFGIPLFNNGSNLVDLTCVENVALACRLSVESSEAAGNIYNISNGTPLPIKELCESLFEAIGQKPRFRKRNAKVLYAVAGLIELIYHSLGITKEPPITRYIVTTLAYSQTLSITHARHDLGYMPVVPIAEGIKRYAEASYAEA
jgi:dTDP-4-dehydrorhamnose 3,5-epimerase